MQDKKYLNKYVNLATIGPPAKSYPTVTSDGMLARIQMDKYKPIFIQPKQT